MTKWLQSRILWGLLLVFAGVVFLLQNLNVIEFGDVFWAVLLGLGGAFFIVVGFSSASNWWAFIPGFTLVGIAVTAGLDQIAPAVANSWGGAIVLGGIGLGFVFVYLMNSQNWWALIPAGVMLTLTLVTGIDAFDNGAAGGGIFFMGLGLTFIAIAVLPTQEGRMTWAWIPGGILLLMGFLILAAAEAFIGYLWPVALILVGGYLIWRTLRPRS